MFKGNGNRAPERVSGAYYSLAELTEEWEDYEEPKCGYIIDPMDENGYSRDDDCFDEADIQKAKELGIWLETEKEAEKAVDKLKAWKRLKDKGFKFKGYTAQAFGEVKFSIEDDWEDCNFDHLQHKADLDLLFGGEE